MLANGYSRAQLERALKQLELPFSPKALEEAQELIRERLDFYKTQPLKSDWFAIFINAYWAKLRTEDGKLQEISLFVAVGIDLDGNKEVLGFAGRSRRSTLWVQRGSCGVGRARASGPRSSRTWSAAGSIGSSSSSPMTSAAWVR